MKKWMLMLAMVASMGFAVGCDNRSEAEKAVDSAAEKSQEAAKDAGKAVEKAGEDLQKKAEDAAH